MRISSAADPATRSFTVEVSVPKQARFLQPGTFAKARFVVDEKPGVLTIPQKALLSEEGIYSVFVVEQDTAYARTVDVGIRNGINAEIISGLESGEEVVHVGQNFLSDGYPVIRSEK
jgi:RND family efflux transporter MFP subunit